MDFDIFQTEPLFEPAADDDGGPFTPICPERRPVGDRTALMRAYVTLTTGCAFVAAQAEMVVADSGVARRAHPSHARMTGNRLHELDRFLSVLIDEIAALRGEKRADARFFAQMRNTPNKLRRLEPLHALDGQVGPRLGAIGRISAYLRHCRQDILSSPLIGDIAIAHGDPESAPPVAEDHRRIRFQSSTLIAIAAFYRSIGDALMESVDRAAP